MRICLVVFLLAILIGCAGDTAPANPVEAQGEVSNLGGARIRLGMTRDEVLEALGEFEFTLDESGTVRGYSPLTPDTDDVGSIYFGDDGLVSRINRNWRQSENQESVVLAEALLGALRPMLDAGVPAIAAAFTLPKKPALESRCRPCRYILMGCSNPLS